MSNHANKCKQKEDVGVEKEDVAVEKEGGRNVAFEYVAVEKEYVAIEKEIQKHPIQKTPMVADSSGALQTVGDEDRPRHGLGAPRPQSDVKPSHRHTPDGTTVRSHPHHRKRLQGVAAV